ncbi:uncharacterized protein LOC105385053 [Plutella xylostella]|uniref:uncharacterized protein LOC105385053 n=1 Tax=Plutella xylostella TaxID=51655 RepID=UPI002032E72A|nr:uncharacterized protein LOC105385053 [Plutella xylostella]
MRLCIIGLILVLSTLKLTSSSPPQDVLIKVEQLKQQIKEKLAKLHDYRHPPPTRNEDKITPILKQPPKKLKIKAIKRYRKKAMEKYQDHMRKIKQQQAAFDSKEPNTTPGVNNLDTLKYREFNITSTIDNVNDKIFPIIANTTNELNVRKIGGRRSIMHNYYRHLNEFKCKENKWVLCHGQITPFLIGQKNDTAEHTYKTDQDNYVFKRIMLLLTLSVEAETKDERAAVLIQISKVNLKLFLWDFKSISLLLSKLITKNGKHTWKNLKTAVKYLFKKWDMNLNDTSTLMKNTKIYRPPCVIEGFQGSTRVPTTINDLSYETTTEDARTEEDTACLKDVESFEKGKKRYPKEEHCDKNKRKEELLRAQEYLDEDDSEEGISLDIE